MKTQIKSLNWITLKPAVIVMLGMLQLNSAIAVLPCDTTPDPCFTGITDILQGRRQILPTDDLLVTATFRVEDEFFQDTDIWTLLTSNSTISSQTKISPYAKVGNINSDTPDYNADSRIGRLFNLPNDVIVTVAPNGVFGNLQLIVKIKDETGSTTFADTIVAFSQNAILQSMALADADGDGYDEIFVSFAGGAFGGVTIAASAVDVNDPSQGLVWRGSVRDNCPYAAISLGNLTGSLQGETSFVGIITSEMTSDCGLIPSGVTPPLLCASLINQGSLSLDTTSTACTTHPDALAATIVDLTVGNFNGELGDEAVWVSGPAATMAGTGPNVFAVDFALNSANELVPAVQDTLDLGRPNISDKVVVSSGRLDWFNTREQAVVGYNGIPASDGANAFDASMVVLTFDNNLQITQTNAPTRIVPVGAGNTFNDLVIGNFDAHIGNVETAERNFNQSIAVLNHVASNLADFFVDIYDVDVADFSLTFKNGLLLTNFEGQFPGNRHLTAGDMRGRSMLLGSPEKLTVSHHKQPSVVLGMPIMHIDYIRDIDNLPDGTPSILNLTTFPTLFYSQYDTDVKEENQSSNKGTTSFSSSTKKSVGGKVSFGIPDIASVKASFKVATKNTHDSSVATQHDSYSAQEFDVSKRTGISDFLWFTSRRFNVFFYPVLGQTICPQDPDNSPNLCAEDEKLPLYVQFSGPDTINQNAVSGALVEWYHGPEPGNVFSNPWNQAQLEARNPPGFNLLSSETWVSDDSNSKVSINWTEGSTTSVTTGSTITHSFDKSASVSADVSFDGFGGGVSGSVDYNSSSAVSTQNTETNSLGASTGIQIIKPPFAGPGDYSYNGETYLFGQSPPAGTLQEIPTDDDFMANGLLRVASTVNPLGPNSSDWWKQAYTLPDIAVNHPLRWDWTAPLSPSEPDIVTFNMANFQDPALSEFYFMRGLFITPSEADGKGPQRTSANESEIMKIEAQILNYSLAAMPDDAAIKVLFFVNEWDNSLGNFTGLSTRIGEPQTLAPLPGFNSGTGIEPNWTTASVNFNTSGYGDQYVVFWVVVWMVDGNGELLPEIEGHGLPVSPASVPGLDFITGVPIDTYANNIGFYNQPFFVMPAENAAVASAATRARDPVVAAIDKALSVQQVTVTPDTVNLQQKTQVAALLQTGDIAPGSALVFFYDGDPTQDGELFDVELIPHLRRNDEYLSRVAYKPGACGVQSVFVEALSAAPEAGMPAFGSAELIVSVDPEAAFTSLIAHVKSFDFSRTVARQLIRRLRRAGVWYAQGEIQQGGRQMRAYFNYIKAQSGKSISMESAAALNAQAFKMISCLRHLD